MYKTISTQPYAFDHKNDRGESLLRFSINHSLAHLTKQENRTQEESGFSPFFVYLLYINTLYVIS